MKNLISLLSLFLCVSLSSCLQEEEKIMLSNADVKITSRLDDLDFPGLKKRPEMISRSVFFEDGETSFQITLASVKDNNHFNDIGEDRIWIHPSRSSKIGSYLGSTSQPLKQTNCIEADGQFYLITEIDSLGRFLKIKKIAEDIEPTVKLFNKLPDLEFQKIDGTTHNFRDYLKDKKYIFVEFWGTWCHGCVDAVPSFKEIYSQHKDELTFIYLNSKDDLEDIESFLKKHQIESWVNGFVTKKLEKELFLNGYPHGVLFDRDGKLLKLPCNSSTLVAFFDKKK